MNEPAVRVSGGGGSELREEIARQLTAGGDEEGARLLRVWEEARDERSVLQAIHDQFALSVAHMVESHGELREFRKGLMEALRPMMGAGGFQEWNRLEDGVGRVLRSYMRMYAGVQREYAKATKQVLEASVEYRKWCEFQAQFVHIARVTSLLAGLQGILKRHLSNEGEQKRKQIAAEIEELAREELSEGVKRIDGGMEA